VQVDDAPSSCPKRLLSIDVGPSGEQGSTIVVSLTAAGQPRDNAAAVLHVEHQR
jgi:hypothetical protein